ncbi:MAG: iron-sulfur cluster assembly accessory protein [Gammaproteobacteria bacterium]|nr:iron-sulfur cluster assembly accessory protein [Gammaproteobacteria bacterium]
MITLTAAAKQHIKIMLMEVGALATTKTAFRLSVKQTGCSGYMYVPEIVEHKKKETDIEIKTPDLLIYIDTESAEILKGTEIDYVKKGLGLYQLEYHNPNADSLCGCGESFNLKNPSDFPDAKSTSKGGDCGR